MDFRSISTDDSLAVLNELWFCIEGAGERWTIYGKPIFQGSSCEPESDRMNDWRRSEPLYVEIVDYLLFRYCLDGIRVLISARRSVNNRVEPCLNGDATQPMAGHRNEH